MKPDNPPAFPNSSLQKGYITGMTLRDYFAIHAPSEEIKWTVFNKTDGDIEMRRARIEARYAYADAMLAERSKEIN